MVEKRKARALGSTSSSPRTIPNSPTSIRMEPSPAPIYAGREIEVEEIDDQIVFEGDILPPRDLVRFEPVALVLLPREEPESIQEYNERPTGPTGSSTTPSTPGSPTTDAIAHWEDNTNVTFRPDWCGHAGRRASAVTRESTKKTRKPKKKICAIQARLPARPPKPRTAVKIAKMAKIAAQFNMLVPRWYSMGYN